MNRENVLFALVGVGFGLFFGFSFVAWANQRARDAPRSASEQTSNADADAAINRARENPNDYDAQMQGARAYYDARRFDEAVRLLQHANELQPNNVEPLAALGDVNADAGNARAAEKWYDAALTLKPDDADVRASLARLFLISDQPDYDRAVAELQRALRADPRNESALQFLAYALAQKGDSAGARDALSRLEKVNPESAAVPRLRDAIDARGGAPQSNSNAARAGAR
ncbi:MAG: tetratricopeptide repeat protein [Acidobacteria bacterium]|nr:tetratricopeptide repeat protein [Acidobacteriota bacterium]